jgi:galactose mutarotase-like enzyme
MSSVPAEHWLRVPGAEAAFTPSDGFNCSAFRVQLRSGSTAHALAEAPDWEALTVRPSFYGDPLLFPFAYGVRGGTLRWAGREHPLKPTRWGRVAHGLVRDHAWTVEREWEDADGAHLRASVTSEGDAQKLAEYPLPFRLTATYSLSGTALRFQVSAVNLGGEPMPFGFGIHPYVPLPLGTGGTPETARSTAELEEIVSSDATHVSVQGATIAEPQPTVLDPVSGAFDLRQGQSVCDLMKAQEAARGRTGLFLTYAKRQDGNAPLSGGLRWSLSSANLGAAVEIETSPNLWGMVLFAPPEPSPVISPVIGTCLPGFLDHPDDPAASASLGLLELRPGVEWTAHATIRVVPFK